MKIVIPRNKLVPDPNFADVLLSDPMTDAQKNPIVLPTTLYRGKDINFAASKNLGEGWRFWNSDGWIYLPKYASPAEREFAIAKEAFMESISPLISFGFESTVGEVPSQFEKLVESFIERKIFPEKESAEPTTIGEFADGLIKRGAFSLPYIQIVEIEYQKVPRFLRQPEHRSLFTYENPSGEKETYGYKYPSAASEARIISLALQKRQNFELDHLISQIKDEQTDTKALMNQVVQKYQSQFGEKWEEHRGEMIEEYFNRRDEEAERKGFNEQRLYAEILNRIAPLVPFYRQIPLYSDWVTILEYTAAGKKEEMLKLPMSEPSKVLLFDV